MHYQIVTTLVVDRQRITQMSRKFVLALVLGLIVAATVMLLFDQNGTVAGLPDEAFASLAFYGAWGVVLLSGMFVMMRTRLHLVLQGGLLWGTLFAILIAVYGFRSELGGLKDRMQAAVFPGALVEVDTGGDARYMAMRGADSHFRLNGSINGIPTSFIVDTGASTVALDRATAERLGMDVSKLRFTRRVLTANGVTGAAPIQLDSVRIGGIVRNDVPAVVTQGSSLGETLLGMSFLDTLTSYDFRRDRLVLTD